MGRKIRVGVIGVGDFGRNHVRVYHELADAELVGVHDADPERARQIAAEFGTQAFSDVASLAAQIDAASVAVPTVFMLKLVLDFCNRASMFLSKNRLPFRSLKRIRTDRDGEKRGPNSSSRTSGTI